MALSPGKRLGPYEILAPLGAGGMGEVYRAKDHKLGRQVAVKVLPDELASDAERLERFEREARAASSLNHPNTVTIHDIDEQDGVHFIAMELVEGRTLRDRLAAGPLPILETLRVAHQVAEGLARAHSAGIVHRDLKPGNVMITGDGLVKILDFGLAKTVGVPGQLDRSVSTVAQHETREGTVLGTTPYMSPEQLRGEAVDRRSDVWSFGCLVYELLARAPAFPGRTVGDTVVAVLEKEPHWKRLPPGVPSEVRRLLERCLRKDVVRRPRDMADIRLEIADVLEEPQPAAGDVPGDRRPRLSSWASGIAATVAMTAILWGAWWLSRPDELSNLPIRFTIGLPPELRMWVSYTSALAVSPDGQTLAFVTEVAGHSQLRTRRLDDLEIVRVAGSDNGDTPFFSPDGHSLGFAANGTYWRVDLAGGEPVPTSTAPKGSRGAVWLPGDRIAFEPDMGAGLHSAPVNGGALSRLTRIAAERGEVGHGWPQLLPDGRRLFFTVRSRQGSRPAILTLDDGRHEVIEGVGDVEGARYVPSGHIVYAQSGVLMALPFDVDRMTPAGAPRPVLDSVFTSQDGVAYFAISESGVLVYAPGGAAAPSRRFVWVTRGGVVSEVPGGHRGPFEEVRVSPDGRSFASLVHTDLAHHELWVQDLMTGRRAVLFSEANAIYPVWIDDGTSVVFASTASGDFDIYRRRADAGAPAEPWLRREGWQRPNTWSADHRMIAFYEETGANGEDIYVLPTDGPAEPVPFLPGPGDQRVPRFSPDGRWIAYVSNETGAWEVHVAEYPSGRKGTVSIGGGREPVWSRDGTRLFYRWGNRMMEVDFDATDQGLAMGEPRLLFEGDFYQDADGHPNYDVAPDGRFLMIERGEEQRPTELRVFVNWFEELERLAPRSDE